MADYASPIRPLLFCTAYLIAHQAQQTENAFRRMLVPETGPGLMRFVGLWQKSAPRKDVNGAGKSPVTEFERDINAG